MAKAKATKSKGNLVEKLLKKAELLALVVAGLGLAILLLTGITTALDAKSSAEIAQDLDTKSNQITQFIRTDASQKPADPPEWVVAKENKVVDSSRFALAAPTFDPTATPDTKRDNPQVLGIQEVQLDLIRAPMMGYDIVSDQDGNMKIAVLKTRQVGQNDQKLLRDVIDDVKIRAKGRKPAPRPVPKQPMVAGGGAGMPPGGGMPGMPGGMPGMPEQHEGGPIGLSSASHFDANMQRQEVSVEYIAVDTLDKVKLNPAMTLIPLRMVVINATFPLKQQVEEMRKALRLQRPEQVAPYGPFFDGFEVRRQVYGPAGRDGKVPVLQPWEDYKYEEKYAEVIDSRKLADHFDTGFLPYFLRFDEAMAMPLPKLVPELAVNYPPPIRLKAIQDAEEELRNRSKVELSSSDLVKRLSGKTPSDKRSFQPRAPGRTAIGLFDKNLFPDAPMMEEGRKAAFAPMPPGGMPAGGRPGEAGQPVAYEPDFLLLRFLDPEVRPGLTYEYQIRVRMKNPNYNRPTEVSNPSNAIPEILYGPWVQIDKSVYVPNESYLYGYETAKYQDAVKEMTSDNNVRKALQAGNNQAVIQVQSWMEQVRVDGTGNREPVGAWVVAEMPVSRGEYIGRRQYIKLPLWSAEASKFVLREVPTSALGIRTTKGKEHPHGWVVDFSTKSILVDFEGGKVTGKVGNRNVSDEAATELLIVRPDGRLIVKNSAEDMKDPDRAQRNTIWDKWVQDVEKRKESGSPATDNGFMRPKAP